VSAGGDWAAHWNFGKVYSWNTAAWALVGEMPEARDSTAKACRGSCSAGKWSNVMGSTTDEDCQLCPAGQFSNDTELTSPTECHPCSAGKYSTQLGLINDTQCLPCPAGKFSSAEGLDSEDKCSGSCSAGKFSSETGLTSNFQCLGECGPGKYSEETGLTSISNCSDCPKGSWSIWNGMNFFLNFLCVFLFFNRNSVFLFVLFIWLSQDLSPAQVAVRASTRIKPLKRAAKIVPLEHLYPIRGARINTTNKAIVPIAPLENTPP
jgi:hypothetical protein